MYSSLLHKAEHLMYLKMQLSCALTASVSRQIIDAASNPTFIQSVEMVADSWRQLSAYWTMRNTSVCVPVCVCVRACVCVCVCFVLPKRAWMSVTACVMAMSMRPRPRQ